ncbi:hypothetical protein BKH41_02525 [Helicobacter sp. 12S02232-10]|uniref:hypothetical protein n=1 Tax=Helicobacter sp. 12S02232-10 TaxID=1476197 RepID=UPI000BA5C86B|nr:hypothetical protein [Helicobacter sp. 12S02232-10]PAF49558.1 hypothetical protein BKH41_02525 [Helicobacter sp. 12S02232-10]
MKKNRNFWPLGILSIIIIGIILLFLLVKLSMMNPIIDDNAYFEKYSEVDKDINKIIKNTEEFENYYTLYIGANQKPLKNSLSRPLSPYFVKGHRDKLKEEPKIELFTNAPNYIYVTIVPKTLSSPISDLNIKLFMTRYHMNTEHLDLGSLQCSTEDFCSSPKFELNIKGRWKAILQVEYTQNNEHKKIFFEKEFFASRLP